MICESAYSVGAYRFSSSIACNTQFHVVALCALTLDPFGLARHLGKICDTKSNGHVILGAIPHYVFYFVPAT